MILSIIWTLIHNMDFYDDACRICQYPNRCTNLCRTRSESTPIPKHPTRTANIVKKNVPGTQSFSRFMDLLQHICDRASPPNLSDLMGESDLTRPTLYRSLAALEAEGLITQTGDKRYHPGTRLVTLARTALKDVDIRSLARPELEHLRDATGETVHLAIRNGEELVYIEKIESHAMVRMASTIGTSVPFHSTSVGKAFLSALSPEESDALIAQLPLSKITPHTTTNPVHLSRRVADVRAAGFVLDDQENELGIVCYGAAIRDANGYPVASVSVSVPLFRNRDDPNFYSAPLKRYVGEISRQLGYSQDPEVHAATKE